jgi:RNA polymerase sigma-70 factor, ECF subfamily
MTNEEAVWVEQARAGDRSAFGNLVGAYERPVYNLCYRMLGNPHEAEDAAQETFLRAYANLEKYDPAHKFSTWIFTIANNHCIDRLRKRRAVYVSIEDNPVLENLESDQPLPEPSAVRMEQSREVQALIGMLEPDYRTPLVLRYWEDYSYEEIAETMELTVAAVKSRLFRARQQIAKLYQDGQQAILHAQVPAASSGARSGVRVSEPVMTKRTAAMSTNRAGADRLQFVQAGMR